MTFILPWPPAYTLKQSTRSRRVTFKASLHRGLEIIIPPQFNHKHLPTLLETHKPWIEKQLHNLQQKQDKLQRDLLPDTIHLLAISQCWKVVYIPCKNNLKLMARPQHELVLMGDLTQKRQCRILLVKWAICQAKVHLLDQLKSISSTTQLSYTKGMIRNQLTRWGSCSAKKVISLNYKLLFFPPALAQHIMLHELCHTVHLNHSAPFWELVGKWDPHWQLHRQTIRHIETQLPGWTFL